jgi:hypothetical protein
MTEDHADFIAKLRQIEEHAHASGAELAPGIARTRLQQIVVLAKTLRGRLEFGRLALVQAATASPPPVDPKPAA